MENDTQNIHEPATESPAGLQPEIISPQAATPPVIPAAPVAGTPTPIQTDEPAVRKRRKKWSWIVLLVLILAAGGYLARHLLYDNHKTNSTTVTRDITNLRYGTLGGPVGSDNLFPNAQGTSESLNVSLQIFEGLVGYKDQKIVPQLATSWTNPSTSTWVFNITKNVKFQNGDAMTAADVARSLNADKQNENYSVYLSTVKTVSVSGPNEVTITTTQPDSLLLNRLVYAFVFKPVGTTDIGTGPYVIDKEAADDTSHITLQAYSGYHGGAPKVKQVTVTTFDDAKTLVAAYNKKQIDMFIDPQAGTAEDSLTAPKDTFTYTVAGSSGLRANTLRPGGALANPKVREAVAYALDRQALAKASDSTLIPTRDIVPKSVIGYSSAATFPAFDLAKSKQLQTEAGYPNGAPLTFMYYKGAQPVPPLIIAQLQAAGFKVTENIVSSGSDFVAQAMKGNYDLLSMTYFSNYNDATDIFTGMIDTKDADFPSYSNPAADALIAASEADFNPASHIEKVKAINKYIADNFLWIPTNTTVPHVYYKPGLQVQSNYVVSQQTTTFWQIGQTVTETSKG